ncbi:histidine phosphatase family protein [Rossellomorea aquimaris]|uniref:histidine phosphatase family protein n=1 Tax=Rossellomorea aquimaris TaxID=189382 RepID=UPI001CD53B5E|nr:histidine phosphatase family protein [Rossellomorea aquimaris]MCA1058551.1 histidine phosphatase family protein [Rossellomorea aquimaris]
MTHICFVRHGQTDWNLKGKLQGQTDIPLNETGEQQAAMCREALKADQWDALITTSLLRAKKTAEIINGALDLDIVEMDHFKERFFGEGEGMLREDREKQFPDFTFPNMESYEELVERVHNGLRNILQQFPDKKVLVVAHGAVISAIIREFHKDATDLGHVKLMNGCLTDLHFEKGEWIVRSFNRAGHLSEHV